MFSIQKRDGFKGQVQFVIPRPMLGDFERHPLLHNLIATDIGWYPNAQYHYRERPSGTDENVVILCTDGVGWCEVSGNRFAIRRNQALILPKGKAHIYAAANDDPWSIYWVHFKGLSATYFVNQLPDHAYTLSVDVDTKHTLVSLYKQCFDALENGYALQPMLFCSQALHHLLGTILFGNPLFSPGMRTSQFHDLSRTVRWLRENIDQKLSLDEMANHARLSVSHFSQLFKQQIGYAPMEYFINLKIQHACHLLDTTHLPIKTISYQLGYEDPYYFSRIFRKVMGCSPKAYRDIPKG